MKASYRWIRALVPELTASPTELSVRLSAAGIAVDGVQRYGAGGEACVLAKVVSVRPHPTKSGLRLVTVDAGAPPQEVVCGAPNVPEPGGLVVLAKLGAHLPAKGMTIERRAIGGIVSEGMLCSEAELGLSDESDGIMVLDASLGAPGEALFAAIPEAEDTIYELDLTPNRPDCLGHVGIARDVAAIYGLSWSMPVAEAPSRSSGVTIDSLAKVVVEDPERCPHYGAASVVDVKIAPSPRWARYRLASLGVRPISNVVDITNLVMLEYGHPMHAFDLDRVAKKSEGVATIFVRRARDGEKLVTLDGVDRALSADDLVICDASGPVALAGIMGGATSEIHAGTTKVLFECAYFEPRGVRRTSRRQGLHTESSHRFERGVDPGDVHHVLLRAQSMTTTLAGGASTAGEINVAGAPVLRREVSLRASRLDALLGIAVPFAEATAILERLGCERRDAQDGAARFVVPTHRPDIAREVDLIDEVVRVRGLSEIPAILPKLRPSREAGGREETARIVRAAAVELGLSEAITYSFVAAADLEKVGAPRPSVILKNPLSELQSVMRTSLLPALLAALGSARRHGERDVRMFTMGPLFLEGTKGGLPDERLSFAAVLAGDRPGHLARPEPIDVWDAKGLAQGLVVRLARREARIVALGEADRPKHLHPRGAAAIFVNDARVGALGPVHPDMVDALDLGGDAMIVEIDVLALASGGRTGFPLGRSTG